MPIYEYECYLCGEIIVEVISIQKMKEYGDIDCPHCKEAKMIRKIGGNFVIDWKGKRPT